MTHHFSLWSTILVPQQKNLRKLIIAHSNGRWILTLTPVNKPNRSYSIEKYRKCHILICFLTIQMFRKQICKNILEWYSKLTFHNQLDVVFTKMKKIIVLLRKLNSILLREALVTIFKTFVRPHLNYGDVLYDQAFNSAFRNKLELIQYTACLIMTGAIRGTWCKILSRIRFRIPPTYRKPCLFYNISKNQHPWYLFNLISVRHSLYNKRNVTNLLFFNTKHSFFKNPFFPSTIIEWNKLDINLCNSRNLIIFKKHVPTTILEFCV